MNKYPSFIRRIAAAFLLILVFALGACASGPQLVNHSFGFDVLADSPDVVLLDYRYGTSRHPGAKPREWALRSGAIEQHSSVSGEMILGETLYIKWRIKSSGEVLEDTVDLKSRLPRDIEGHRLYFVVERRQLNVYLISPRLRPPDFPVVGPAKYRYYQAYVIYPNSTLNN